MLLEARIALRYLFSRKSHGAVNVISAISVAGVAVAVAAMVAVLSVFNGFADLARTHYAATDAPITIYPALGNVIVQADSLSEVISSTPGVKIATPVVEQRGLLSSGDKRMGVVFKGVTAEYEGIVALDSVTVAAPLRPLTGSADVSVGVANALGLRPGVSQATLYVPRRRGRINPANPATAFFSTELSTGRVWQTDQMDVDADHIYLPLTEARRILQYDTEATAIELAVDEAADIMALKRLISYSLGPEYKIVSADEKHTSSLMMISIEKWITFAMLIFILIIAAFNIVSTLSLMVIEKHDNMETLRFLGARRSMVRGVFSCMGGAITIGGAIAGIALGTILVLAQQWGGFIHLGGDPSQLTTEVYPVRLEGTDLLVVFIIALTLSVVTAGVTRFFTKRF